MQSEIKEMQERIAFLQRHIEQQDRAFLELSKEITALSQRLARMEGKVNQLGGDEEGPPADSKPPHW
jgi:uncharacterized coiled-coil protein SlyX